MYCAKALQLACRCLPQRLKPQTAGRIPVYRFSSPAVLQHATPVLNHIHLKCNIVPFLYRAKNQYFLGLLALFFCRFVWNNLIEENL